jgi:hypothetical protein
MLSTFEMATAMVLFIGDILTVVRYTDGLFRPKHYPKRVLAFHAIGGLCSLAVGSLSLIAYQTGFATVGSTAAVFQGICTTLCLGLASMPMARYTKGCPGYNLTGYMSYALACVYSGLVSVFHPSPRTSWACFVVAHAYLTCRVAVNFFENKLRWKGDSSYSAVATSVATGVPLTLAYGLKGIVANALFVLIGLALQSGGIGRIHAFRGRKGKQTTQHEKGARVCSFGQWQVILSVVLLLASAVGFSTKILHFFLTGDWVFMGVERASLSGLLRLLSILKLVCMLSGYLFGWPSWHISCGVAVEDCIN